MKIKIYTQTTGDKVRFQITQDADISVTAFKIDERGMQSSEELSIGKWGDIDDIEVQGYIHERLDRAMR